MQASSVQLSLTACLIGLAIGQFVFGPLSDRLGRRAPLLLGISAFVVSSVACSVVNNLYALDAFRFLEGVSGAAGIVISRAIVRDLFEGATAARFFSMLMLVIGAGPILAPQIGAQILRATSWRGIFLALATIGIALFVMSLFQTPETLPPERRHTDKVLTVFHTLRVLLRDRTFVGYAAISSLGLGTIFAYIAGSPFVLQDVYGLSPQVFSLVFAMNAACLVTGAQINAHLVRRHGSGVLLSFGLGAMTLGSVAFTATVSLHRFGLAGILPDLSLVLFGVGFVTPNAMALALQNHPKVAGLASALLGSSQYTFAAAVAPLVGIAGSHDAIPMALVMVALATSAGVLRFTLARTHQGIADAAMDSGDGAQASAIIE